MIQDYKQNINYMVWLIIMVDLMVAIILRLLLIMINGINLMIVLLVKLKLIMLLPVLLICCSMRGNDYLRLCYHLFYSIFYLFYLFYLLYLFYSIYFDIVI